METLFNAIRHHYNARNAHNALYHRHMAKRYIKEARAAYPKPAQARAQARYLEQCRCRAMFVLGL